jgi:serine/threonine protein kinase
VWSLGVTLYAMAAGKLPWPEQLKQAQFHDHIRGGLRDVDPAVPPEFAEILHAMIVGDPLRRAAVDQLSTAALQQPTRRCTSFSRGKVARAWVGDMSGIKVSSSCLTRDLLAQAQLAAPPPSAVCAVAEPAPEEEPVVKRTPTGMAEKLHSGLDFQMRATRHFLKGKPQGGVPS